VGRAVTVAAFIGVLAALSACSEAARHRFLSFFLDGVPPPGSQTAAGERTTPQGVGPVEPASLPAVQRSIPHTPYRETRCGGCHDADSGQLIRPVRDGLCLTCHAKLIAGAAFVHGPVAVNDCTVCHHYHAAPLPNLLLLDATATCLNCHDRGDLSAGAHHAAIDQRGCTDCHDPHGGGNRFFVKGSAP